MGGVAWGAPPELKYAGRMIPDGDLPVWSAQLINGAFDQDDLYATNAAGDTAWKQVTITVADTEEPEEGCACSAPPGFPRPAALIPAVLWILWGVGRCRLAR